MLTPEQLAKIRANQAATPAALQRDPYTNYREGYFHVTLNTRDEVPVLGWMAGKAGEPRESKDAPRVELSDLGKKIWEVKDSINSYHPGVDVIIFIAMPEHVHLLLHLKPGNTHHLGRIINGFMIGCTHSYWDTLGIPWRQMRAEKDAAALTPELEKTMRAQWQDRDHTRSFRGPSLFVRGYNDVEAVTPEEVAIKIEYIRANPERRIIKGCMPEVFRIRRSMTSANWTPIRIMQGLCADRFIAADRNKQVTAWQQLTVSGIRNAKGKVSATLKFRILENKPSSSQPAQSRPVLDFVGNMELLGRPLFPLICHRADVARYEEQMAAVLAVAREHGGVIVTACVSPKERDIVKLLHLELLPIIEVMDNGFSDRYKPSGKAFYAVAESRRLEVSPWEYVYRHHEQRAAVDAQGHPVLDTQGKPVMEEIPDITREMCMVMNELVRVIAGKEDDWWKQPISSAPIE